MARPKAGEDGRQWLLRWAAELARELSGPIEMACPKLSVAQAWKWLGDADGLDRFEGDWRALVAKSGVEWTDFTFWSQEGESIFARSPGSSRERPGFVQACRRARAAGRLARGGPKAARAAAGQRANARSSALQAVELLGPGPGAQWASWSWGWARVAGRASEAEASAFALCCAASAWVSSDALPDAAASLLAGLGRFGDRWAGQLFEDRSTADLYEKLLSEAAVTNVCCGFGGAQAKPPVPEPRHAQRASLSDWCRPRAENPWGDAYGLKDCHYRHSRFEPAWWEAPFPERFFDAKSAVEAARRRLWSGAGLDWVLRMVEPEALHLAGWRGGAAREGFAWAASAHAGPSAASLLPRFFENPRRFERWMQGQPKGRVRAVLAALASVGRTDIARAPSGPVLTFGEGSWVPDALAAGLRLIGAEAMSARDLLRELGLAPEPAALPAALAAAEAAILSACSAKPSEGGAPAGMPAARQRRRL